MNFKLNTIKATLAAVGMGLMSHAAWAGNITDINVSSLPNQQKVIKIRFDRDVTTPSGFTTPTPARIALDFANTGLQLQQPLLEYDDVLLKQIAAAENGDRARLMLSLGKPGEYNTEVKGNEVWVYVKESTGSNRSNAPTTQRQAPPAAVVNEVRTETVYVERPAAKAAANARMNVDFRKGANNTGIIDVATGSFSGEPTVTRQADRLVFTYKNTPLPTELQRNLDVTDFSTPVRTIALRRLGNDT